MKTLKERELQVLKAIYDNGKIMNEDELKNLCEFWKVSFEGLIRKGDIAKEL